MFNFRTLDASLTNSKILQDVLMSDGRVVDFLLPKHM